MKIDTVKIANPEYLIRKSGVKSVISKGYLIL